MAFTDIYNTVLTPFLKKFKDAENEKVKKTILKNASEAVIKSRDTMEVKGDLPKDLEKAIGRYFKASLSKPSVSEENDPKPTKLKQVYTIRDVIKRNYQKRIADEIPYDTKDKRYLSSYQQAVTTVHQKMTEGDLEDVQKLMDLWNTKGPPADMQLKMAKGRLPKDMQKKVEEWKFCSGAVMMCMVAYSDGKEVQAFHVESSQNVGNSFTNSCDTWRDGTYENFKEWAVKQFGMNDLESNDEAEVPVDMQKAKDIAFQKNGLGHLILPPLDGQNTKQRQRLVRGYIGAVYREFTGNKKAAFPYLLASKSGQEIYSPDCAPDGFSLGDPDHLTGFKITALYNHWLARQKKKLQPFVVLKPGPLHEMPIKKSAKAKGKEKEYVPVSSDDDGGNPASSDDDMGNLESSDDDEGNQGTLDEDDDKAASDSVRGRKKKEKEIGIEEGSGDEDGGDRFGKIGPPHGKRTNTASRSRVDDSPSPAAGSSNARAVKKLPKSRRDKEVFQSGTVHRNDAEIARKEEIKTSPASPERLERVDKKTAKQKPQNLEPKPKVPKRRKTDDSKGLERTLDDLESNPGGSKKRKNDGEEGSPVKRKRVEARENSRVKEFPAGNVATSSARIAFLKTLCKIPKFCEMVDLVPAMPKASPIPEDFPPWASWKSQEVFLPESFHTIKSFNKNLALAKKGFGEDIFSKGKIDSTLLLVGLMYREACRAMEMEPEGDGKSPVHLVNSSIGLQQVKKIETLIKAVVVPS